MTSSRSAPGSPSPRPTSSAYRRFVSSPHRASGSTTSTSTPRRRGASGSATSPTTASTRWRTTHSRSSLALVRGVVELDRAVRAGDWRHEAAGPLQRISDLRLGIVGFGRIGRALAVRAQGARDRGLGARSARRRRRDRRGGSPSGRPRRPASSLHGDLGARAADAADARAHRLARDRPAPGWRVRRQRLARRPRRRGGSGRGASERPARRRRARRARRRAPDRRCAGARSASARRQLRTRGGTASRRRRPSSGVRPSSIRDVLEGRRPEDAVNAPVGR